MNLKHLTLSLSLLILTACEPKPTEAPSSYLKYIDTNQFDQKLSQSMQQNEREIEIAALSPFSTNNIPERLNNWLSVISDNGGKVKTEPAEGERILGTLKIIFDSIYNQGKYKSAAKYDAKLIYRRNESGEAMIEKVIFTNR